MDTYEVVPLQGVGAIRLGMTREETRSIMASPFQSRQRRFDPAAIDAYLEACFQIFFDDKDKVDYIELSRRGTFTALYKDASVFQTKVDNMVALVLQDAEVDKSDREYGYSYIFPALELSLWRAVMPEPQDDPADLEGVYFDTIGIGKFGYYSAPAKWT